MSDLFQNINGKIVPRDVSGLNFAPSANDHQGNPKRDPCARKHGGNEQSVSAFDYVMNNLTARQAKVLDCIRYHGAAGLTVDELALQWRTTPNAISGRFTDLKIKGRIEQKGTRKTRSGCSAAVWVAK